MTYKNSYNKFDPSKAWPPGGVASFYYIPMGKTLKNLLLKPVGRIENNLAEMVTR